VTTDTWDCEQHGYRISSKGRKDQVKSNHRQDIDISGN
jgi:hypothetical protein